MVHSYGGIVLHDVINDRFAKEAIEKGADGLIAVTASAGGHAGTTSPMALIQEIREWFDGLLLSGSIATGDAVLAAQAWAQTSPISVCLHRHRRSGRRAGLQTGYRGLWRR